MKKKIIIMAMIAISTSMSAQNMEDRIVGVQNNLNELEQVLNSIAPYGKEQKDQNPPMYSSPEQKQGRGDYEDFTYTFVSAKGNKKTGEVCINLKITNTGTDKEISLYYSNSQYSMAGKGMVYYAEDIIMGDKSTTYYSLLHGNSVDVKFIYKNVDINTLVAETFAAYINYESKDANSIIFKNRYIEWQ